MDRFINIGKFLKPYRLKGEIKVDLYIDDISILDDVKEYYIKNEKGVFTTVDIETVRSYKDIYIITLKNIENRTDIEGYKNQNIYIKEKDLPELKDNEYYIKDLYDLEIYENEVYFGVVKNVFEAGNMYYLLVMMKDKKEVAIPINDDYIENIDIKIKKIAGKNLKVLL